MLNVGSIKEGFVLDHIKAGKSMEIYHYLGLDELDCQVAIIKNAKSSKMGLKDIIKIECPIDVIYTTSDSVCQAFFENFLFIFPAKKYL